MSDIPWWVWTLIVLGAVSVPYWLGPILIHGSQKLKAVPDFSELGPQSEIPEDVAEFFQTTAEQFARLGFTPVVRAMQEGFTSNVRTYIDLHRNEQSSHSAVSVAAFGMIKTADGPQWRLRSTYVQFTAGYTDEGSTLTSNSRNVDIFAPIPGKAHYKFETREIASLYAAHVRLDRANIRGRAHKPRPTDPIKHLIDSMTRELTQQVGTGYLYRDGDYFRPTWKGAFCMVYKLLPPLKGRLRAKELRVSEEALKRAS